MNEIWPYISIGLMIVYAFVVVDRHNERNKEIDAMKKEIRDLDRRMSRIEARK